MSASNVTHYPRGDRICLGLLRPERDDPGDDDNKLGGTAPRRQLRAVPRIAGSLLMIQEALQAKPVATVATLREATGLTTPTINSLLRELESRGIIKESTGRARDRVYVYRRYIEALAAEEEARVSAAGAS